jgi:DNA-binding MarR family transcriptional regulator
MNPTPTQARVLRAIRTTTALRAPFPPRLEDVRLELGLSTRSAVTYHLPALEKAGWVEMGPNRRGLALTAAGKRAAWSKGAR